MNKVLVILATVIIGSTFLAVSFTANPSDCRVKEEVLSENEKASHKIIWTANDCGGGNSGLF